MVMTVSLPEKFPRNLLENRREHLARSAPFRRKIHKHRLIAG